MGATIGSGNLLTEVWGHQNGTFQVVVGIALGQMADLAKIPTILAEMRDQIGNVLHEAWPDRFPAVEPGSLLIMIVSDYPEGEQAEFARAVRAAGASLRDGSLPSSVKALYDQGFATGLAKAADDLTDLCGRSIVAGSDRTPAVR